MKLEIINEKALQRRLKAAQEAGPEDILACDAPCDCQGTSDFVNNICPSPEWIVGWQKACC